MVVTSGSDRVIPAVIRGPRPGPARAVACSVDASFDSDRSTLAHLVAQAVGECLDAVGPVDHVPVAVQQGIARGIDDSGALLVETSDGVCKLSSGEVSLRALRSPDGDLA